MLGCKVDFCENNKCKYGQCKLRKKKGGYRCKCKRGYLGKYCDKGQYLVIIYVYMMKMKFNLFKLDGVKDKFNGFKFDNFKKIFFLRVFLIFL